MAVSVKNVCRERCLSAVAGEDEELLTLVAKHAECAEKRNGARIVLMGKAFIEEKRRHFAVEKIDKRHAERDACVLDDSFSSMDDPPESAQ